MKQRVDILNCIIFLDLYKLTRQDFKDAIQREGRNKRIKTTTKM